MSKNGFRKFRVYDDCDDWDEDIRYSQQIKERRKIKRMKNAIKSRNIDDLLDLDEQY